MREYSSGSGKVPEKSRAGRGITLNVYGGSRKEAGVRLQADYFSGYLAEPDPVRVNHVRVSYPRFTTGTRKGEEGQWPGRLQ